MRHRRKGHRSGARRKTDWRGFVIGTAGFIPFTTQPDTGFGTVSEVAYGWAKWPAGLQNTGGSFGGTGQLEPVDETLIHISCKFYATLQNFTATDAWYITAGVIPWESVFPSDFNNVLGSGADNPDPFNPSLDWVWRETFISCNDPATTGDYVAFFPTLDVEFSSRAMRKLPETTGLLVAVSLNNPNEALGNPSVDCAFGLSGRYLVKSGSAF